MRAARADGDAARRAMRTRRNMLPVRCQQTPAGHHAAAARAVRGGRTAGSGGLPMAAVASRPQLLKERPGQAGQGHLGATCHVARVAVIGSGLPHSPLSFSDQLSRHVHCVTTVTRASRLIAAHFPFPQSRPAL